MKPLVGRIRLEAVDAAGKRFARCAQERDRTLTWTCRGIDPDVKYLPGR